MISYWHIPALAICFFIIMFIRRWWICINRLGFTREVTRRAPGLTHGDLISVASAITAFLIAAVDWSGITLPRMEAPVSPGIAVFMSWACTGISAFLVINSGERIAGNWAGTRESAIRTVAALRIIDAAELAHALRVLEENEAHLRQEGHCSPEVADALAVLKKAEVIEGEAREVRK